MTRPIVPSANAADRIGATSKRRGSRTVLITFAALVLIAGACTAGSSPSTAPVASDAPASPTAPIPTPTSRASTPPLSEPSDAPSVEPPAPSDGAEAPSSQPFIPAGLGPDTLGVVVATDGLRVRSLPAVGEASQRLEPTLHAGVPFFVVEGPVEADGYAWYQVDPYGDDPGPVDVRMPALPFGWVAAGSREGVPWIERYRLGCDSIGPSAELLVSGEPLEQLFCNGNVDLTIEGNVYCTHADDHNGGLSGGPEWITELGYCEVRTEVGARWLYGEPVTRLIEAIDGLDKGRYTITGHFDDPGARDCRSGQYADSDPPDPAAVVLMCRTFFVVTEAIPAH